MERLSLRSDCKFRTWDIGDECEAYWYPNLGLFAPSPNPNFQDEGHPLFSRQECSSLWAENEPW